MRWAHSAAVLATGHLALTNALPAATYSVVDVGGPSTEPANTVYATVTASSKPETITSSSALHTVTEEHTITIETPSEPTVTKSWTVTIGGTAVSVVTTTVLVPEETPLPVVAATDTIYYGIPAAPAPETTSSSCSTTSTSSSASRNAFVTAVSSRSHSKPTATGSFTHWRFATGFAGSSSGFATRYSSAGPIATGGYAAAPTAYNSPSWNETAARL